MNIQNAALISAQYIIQTTSALLQAQKKDKLQDIFKVKEMDREQRRQYYLELLAFTLSNAVFGKNEILKEKTPNYIGSLFSIMTSLFTGDEQTRLTFSHQGSFTLEEELNGFNFDKEDFLNFIQDRIKKYAGIARNNPEENRVEQVVAAAVINMDILQKADYKKANEAMIGFTYGLVEATNKIVTSG